MSEKIIDVTASRASPPDMESPFEGRAYSLPVRVAGWSMYGFSNPPNYMSLAHLNFQLQPTPIQKDMVITEGGGHYRHDQQVQPGPCSVTIQYEWVEMNPIRGDKSEVYDTGIFYVLTPPE